MDVKNLSQSALKDLYDSTNNIDELRAATNELLRRAENSDAQLVAAEEGREVQDNTGWVAALRPC